MILLSLPNHWLSLRRFSWYLKLVDWLKDYLDIENTEMGRIMLYSENNKLAIRYVETSQPVVKTPHFHLLFGSNPVGEFLHTIWCSQEK